MLNVDTLKISSLVLVMISRTSVPICNHFHAGQANIGKITSFSRVPHLSPSRSREPSHTAA